MAVVVRTANFCLYRAPNLRRLGISASTSSYQIARRSNPAVCCLIVKSIGSEDQPKTPSSSTENTRRILWSDVVVNEPRSRVVSGRKWSSLEAVPAGVILVVHLLCLLAPFTFQWAALWTAVTLAFVTGVLGITVSFHRNLTHRSFTLPKWLEYTFAYCGNLALQGNPVDWVSIHRYHHQYCDSDLDPHSPTKGFWYSYISWVFDISSNVGGHDLGASSSPSHGVLLVGSHCAGTGNVGDLEKQSFYRFLRKTYLAHSIALAVILYIMGGLPFLVWGMGVRTVFVLHITFLVNSVCHVWGRQAWNTGDLSRNNWWVALLSFGEGWHNNHHAFEYSARLGLEWWEVDAGWYIVRLLQVLGLATDVKVPTDLQKQTMSLSAAVINGGE